MSNSARIKSAPAPARCFLSLISSGKNCGGAAKDELKSKMPREIDCPDWTNPFHDLEMQRKLFLDSSGCWRRWFEALAQAQGEALARTLRHVIESLAVAPQPLQR